MVVIDVFVLCGLQELAMRDTLSGRNVSYDDLGELEKAELKVMVRSYLQGEISLDEVQVSRRICLTPSKHTNRRTWVNSTHPFPSEIYVFLL